MGVADEFSRHVTDGHNVVFVHLLTVAVIDSQRAAARVSEPCWRPDRERCAAQVTLPHTVFILRPRALASENHTSKLFCNKTSHDNPLSNSLRSPAIPDVDFSYSSYKR
jgi:hypothetical protein